MSEYMERHAVSRLIGAPPGYVGYDQGGQLTEVVRRRPYSVVLLDEIEKAHPDVYSVFLQLLDEGRLTDGQGRLVDFRNTIIIMTSNIGSDLILGATDLEAVRPQVQERLRQAFKPEFLNRLDEVITFNRLDRDQILHIVDLEVARLQRRLADRDITIELTKDAREHLADLGFDPAFGARPLKRAVQQHLQNQLARELLAGAIDDGQHVVVTRSDGGEREFDFGI
jgi:ATP-dependent Clp protease ATP-binding subunit ClpB